MKASLIRHSKTAGNLMGRYIGTTDEPLCEEGLRLLEGKTYPPAQALYVSPLRRCRETGAFLYPELTPVVEDNLRECNFGAFENKNYQELNGNRDYQAWVDSGGTLPFPGGESREVFQERCRLGFLHIMEDALEKQYDSVAIVAHGGTLMSVLSAFAVPSRPFYDWQVKNAQGFLLEIPKDFLIHRKLRVLEKIS